MSESAPQPPAVIAEINYQNGYQALVHAQERKIAITSPHIAQMANLPDYYICKLLSVHPMRRIGMISLGPLLGVLGIKLLMVEDPEAVARYNGRLPQRNETCVHNGAAITFTFSRRHMQKIGQNGALVRWARIRKRKPIARKGGKARWAKARGNGKTD